MSGGVKYISRTLITNPYMVGLCTNKKAFDKEIKRLKIPKNDVHEWLGKTSLARSHAFIQPKTGELCALVCIEKPSKYTKAVVHGSLAHEATHIYQWFKEAIKEYNPSPEFEAYVIGNITINLCKAYKNAR